MAEITVKISDKKGIGYDASIKKIGRDSAMISIANDSGKITELRRNRECTYITGNFKTRTPITIQINCNPKESTLTIRSGLSSEKYFTSFQDCVRLVTWMKNYDIPVIR